MSPGELALLGSVLGAVATGLAAIIVARTGSKSTAKSAKEASAVTFAANLTQRLETVEQEIKDLRGELLGAQRVIQAATGYIDGLLWWLRTGRRGRMPHPPRILQDHLDPSLIDETADEESESA